jgi:hypothetical protein
VDVNNKWLQFLTCPLCLSLTQYDLLSVDVGKICEQ